MNQELYVVSASVASRSGLAFIMASCDFQIQLVLLFSFLRFMISSCNQIDPHACTPDDQNRLL